MVDTVELTKSWDPLAYVAVRSQYSDLCIRRIQRDIANLMEAPPSGMMIHVPEDDFTEIHAIIPGPSGTPYCGGFFYFILKCTSEYPLAPPKVRLMTTGAGTVRFSPNFYSDGKVCLSILRTWYGPGWLPTMTLEGVLLSIQSVMSTNPLHNEPGFNPEESGPCEVLDYNLYVATETLQTAVAGMLQDRNIPEPLQEFMQKSFVKNFSLYEELAVKNMMEAPKFMASESQIIKFMKNCPTCGAEFRQAAMNPVLT